MVTITQNPVIFRPKSLEEWLENPPQGTEWVQGCLVEKTDVTLKHSKTQCSLSTLWANYQEAQGLGGEVYISPPCRTLGLQGRKPDVAYLTSALPKIMGYKPRPSRTAFSDF